MCVHLASFSIHVRVQVREGHFSFLLDYVALLMLLLLLSEVTRYV